jgi:hypothetical protein
VSKYIIYRHCVAGRGWGMLSPVGDHILQEFKLLQNMVSNTLYLTSFRTYKIARSPQTKIEEGRDSDR